MTIDNNELSVKIKLPSVHPFMSNGTHPEFTWKSTLVLKFWIIQKFYGNIPNPLAGCLQFGKHPAYCRRINMSRVSCVTINTFPRGGLKVCVKHFVFHPMIAIKKKSIGPWSDELRYNRRKAWSRSSWRDGVVNKDLDESNWNIFIFFVLFFTFMINCQRNFPSISRLMFIERFGSSESTEGWELCAGFLS